MKHPDWCDRADDPQAVMLWRSARPAMVEVWCGPRRHRIAKVYSLPGGPKLCVPGFRIRDQQLYGTAGVARDSEAHFHTWLHDLTSSRDLHIIGRCSCGTFLIERERVRQAVSRSTAIGQTCPVYASWTD